MVAVDTNVIVRLLTKDDPSQYEQAYKLFATEAIFIANTVILETEWVLRFAYKFSSSHIVETIRLLLGLPNVNVENADQVITALLWHERGLDFADAFHLAASQACDIFFTFDKRFVQQGKQINQSCQLQQL